MEEEHENNNQNGANSIYPEPTRGSLADNHTKYAQEIKFVGGDPDKHNVGYFIIFVIILGILFGIAVRSFTG